LTFFGIEADRLFCEFGLSEKFEPDRNASGTIIGMSERGFRLTGAAEHAMYLASARSAAKCMMQRCSKELSILPRRTVLEPAVSPSASILLTFFNTLW
jgi:hypothetical protein